MKMVTTKHYSKSSFLTLGDLENDWRSNCHLIFALVLIMICMILSSHEITLHGLREGGDMYCFTLFMLGIIMPGVVVSMCAWVLDKEIMDEALHSQ